MQDGQKRKVVTRSECFWCLSLFLLCIKLAEKNKKFTSWSSVFWPSRYVSCLFIPLLSIFGSRTSVIPASGTPNRDPDRGLGKEGSGGMHAYVLVSVWGYGATSREMGQQGSKERALFTEILCSVLRDRWCKLSKSLNVFCLMSKSALKINIIVLCFIV
jgi:hypothetical protein